MLKESLLLIMLTATDGPTPEASFIEVESHQECAERAQRAIAVFPQAGLEYTGHYCTQSRFVFSPFMHSENPEGPAYGVTLSFNSDKSRLKDVRYLGENETCVADSSTVCVISYQSLGAPE